MYLDPARRCAALLLALLLSACAVTPETTAPLDRNEHQRELQALSRWHLNGKLAIQSPKLRESGYLDWRQDGNRYRINLYGPLGSGSVELVGDDASVRLRHRGEEQQAQDPQLLLYEHTGLLLPVDLLYYWVRGLPAPEVGSEDEAWEQGLLTSMRQAGWTVQFADYQPAYQLMLPARITLQQDQTRVVLLVKQWNDG